MPPAPDGQTPARPRALLLDWDNTLVDSWEGIRDALNTALVAMNVKVSSSVA